MFSPTKEMSHASLCAGYDGLGLALGDLFPYLRLDWYAEIHPAASKVMAANHPGIPNLGDLTQISDPPPVDIVSAGFPCQPISSAGLKKGMDDERWIIDDVCRVARESGAEWLILENVPGIVTGHTLVHHCGGCGTRVYDPRTAGERTEDEDGNPTTPYDVIISEWGDCPACGWDLADGSRITTRHVWFPAVLRAMAVNGFAQAEWGTLAASSIGAPHRRLRWFCVARHTTNKRREWGGATRNWWA
jgi:DNA (cytosine-5)-methyltransferase 1